MSLPVLPTTLLTGAIVVGGYWSQKKALDIKMVIGFTVIVLGLSVLDNASPELASGIAVLILVSALLIYIPSIVKSLNRAGVK